GHVAPAAGACPRAGARRRAAHHRGQVLLRRRPQALPARGLLRAVRGHRPWLSLSRRADPGDGLPPHDGARRDHGGHVHRAIVRWYGPDRIRDFLRILRDEVKERAPAALVSYANFPSTEYLDVTDFVDFVSFNVYLHREVDFRRYLSRLQNIAEDKPLVLTEFGVDSLREGADRQAELLSWMIRAGFESGVAGTFVFSWTDDWFAGGAQIA